MAEYDNSSIAESPVSVEVPFRTDSVYENARPSITPSVDYPLATSELLPQAEATIVDGVPKKTPVNQTQDNGYLGEAATVGWETWFESFHVIPREFAFGNILSDQTASIEVYSAFRRTDHNWTVFTNNAGAGLTLSGIPSLPHTFVPQSQGGLTLELQISTSGTPNVDTTLDFTFGTVPQTIQVPITLKRVVLFAISPELPFTERLQWMTEVQPHIDGTEMRISARKNPRQLFEWNFIMEDGTERSRFHNIMFDWQASIFGLPTWYEMTRTTSAVSVSDTTINVSSTDYADYRVGGLVVVFQNSTTFDVLELASLTSTSLTLTSGVLNGYPVGTMVMPLRTGFARRQVSGSRFISGDATMTIQFRVDDNDVDLADTSAFSQFNSKVLIDTCNSVRGRMSEQFERDIVSMDNTAGLTLQSSPWAVGKRIHQLALLAKGKQGLWEVRQLLHALRGKQISFYVSSFTEDFTLDTDIASGTTINIVNIGYTQFVQSRQPKNVIRIVYNNGDPDDLRTIVSSSVVDSTREALVVDSSLGAHTIAQVEKIMLVEKARWDTDEIIIRHEIGDTTTRIAGPVKTVLE